VADDPGLDRHGELPGAEDRGHLGIQQGPGGRMAPQQHPQTAAAGRVTA